jgi:hypothetical protein
MSFELHKEASCTELHETKLEKALLKARHATWGVSATVKAMLTLYFVCNGRDSPAF